MRNLKLTKVVAIIEPPGHQGAVARFGKRAFEFLNPHELHQVRESDD
jgi:hypothetical protein